MIWPGVTITWKLFMLRIAVTDYKNFYVANCGYGLEKCLNCELAVSN